MPTPPSAWSKEDVPFWQYTDEGKVAGIMGDVDLDLFTGASLADWGYKPSPTNNALTDEQKAAMLDHLGMMWGYSNSLKVTATDLSREACAYQRSGESHARAYNSYQAGVGHKLGGNMADKEWVVPVVGGLAAIAVAMLFGNGGTGEYYDPYAKQWVSIPNCAVPGQAREYNPCTKACQDFDWLWSFACDSGFYPDRCTHACLPVPTCPESLAWDYHMKVCAKPIIKLK